MAEIRASHRELESFCSKGSTCHHSILLWTHGVLEKQLPTHEPLPWGSGMQQGVPICEGMGQNPLYRQAVFWKGCPKVLLPMTVVLHTHTRAAPKDHKTQGGHGGMV